nr:hypothetical protein [candidate division Zixibacteria bacterium]
MSLSMYYNIEIDEQRKIVISKIYSIWKEETARSYHEDYMQAVQPLLREKWSKLTNLANWKSSYPEIIQIIGEHMRWCHENGAVYSIYAIDNPVTTRQLKQMIEQAGADESAKLFRSYDEADRFLKEKGF